MRDEIPWFQCQVGPGAVVATAIHDGHSVGARVLSAMALGDDERLREEDPFTGQAIVDVPTHLIVNRSRFEVDLNRDRDNAVYRTAEQCWGLELWHEEPDDSLVETSLAIHDAYYAQLAAVLDGVAARHPRFVLLDVHSYNHRRDGPEGAPTDPSEAPDINIGTFSMPREEWAYLLDPLIEAMRAFDFNGRRLDVRENVAFQGKGEQTRFVHDRYPAVGCAIAIEFKKFFMDEWTGRPDQSELAAMRGFIGHVAAEAGRLLAR